MEINVEDSEEPIFIPPSSEVPISYGEPDPGVASFMSGEPLAPQVMRIWGENEDPDPQEPVLLEEVLCTVTNPERVGTGTNSYVVYRVTSLAEGTSVSSIRRYNDFFTLHGILKEEFRHIIIPPIPGKDMITAIKQNSLAYVEGDPSLSKMISPRNSSKAPNPVHKSPLEQSPEEFTECRRKALEKFLQRVLAHSTLKDAAVLKVFLTSKDFEKEWHQEKAVQAAQVPKSATSTKKGIFASFSGILTGPTPVAPKEVDPWFDSQRNYLLNLERSVQLVADRSNQYSNKNRESIKTMKDFGDAAWLLSKAEEEQDNSMCKHLEKLNQLLKQAAVIQETLGNGVDSILRETLRDQAKTTQAARDLVNYRIDVLGKYQTYCADEKIKEEKAAKSKNANVAAELEEARVRKGKEEQTFEFVSNSAKKELESFHETRKVTTHKMLKEYVQLNIDTVSKEAGLWKEFLGDLQETSNSPTII